MCTRRWSAFTRLLAVFGAAISVVAGVRLVSEAGTMRELSRSEATRVVGGDAATTIELCGGQCIDACKGNCNSTSGSCPTKPTPVKGSRCGWVASGTDFVGRTCVYGGAAGKECIAQGPAVQDQNWAKKCECNNSGGSWGCHEEGDYYWCGNFPDQCNAGGNDCVVEEDPTDPGSL